ncbi:MAG: hypothetical protein KatS3mg105_2365 [Gemmatales bacterium]|nr:MAG: hypothetical protein KatS3mg105_2365 [Gemmatales bacterium]
MRLLDRLLFFSYIKSYVFCLVSLLTLYVVVDLFTNLDDFTKGNQSLGEVLRHIGKYYSYTLPQIFNRLSEAIVLLAATFTVALLQRNNELLPLLSAGVSTRRVVLPVMIASCAMLGLSVANQELVIPQIGERLTWARDDVDGKQIIPVRGAYEPNGIHIDGRFASRIEQSITTFFVTVPERLAGRLIHLTAKKAYYIPPKEGEPRSGGWLLTETTPENLGNWNHPAIEMIDPGKFFLRVRRVDFQSLTRSKNWYVNASIAQIREELDRPESTRLAAMAVLFHMRLTRPLLGLILVALGLSVILRDQNRNVFISAGLCLVLCGIFFAAQFAAKSLGDNEYISPALAAWLPVLTFGPLAFAMYDSMHT